MNQEIKVVAANLQRDVDVLLAALNSCAQAIEEVRARYPKGRIQIRPTAELALWAHYRFGGVWSEFVEFTCQAADAHTDRFRGDKDDKSQLWVMSSPLEESPEPDALRHFDRLLMALQMIAKELSMRVPVEVPVRGYEEEIQRYERVQTFVRAANDVLNPEPPVRRIPTV